MAYDYIKIDPVERFGLTPAELRGMANIERRLGNDLVASCLQVAASGYIPVKRKNWLDKLKAWFYSR